jgi:mannosyltransferase OCH1-like enzyme
MESLYNFEVNFWTNVEPSVLFKKGIPESFKRINFKNIETLDSYLPFKDFFESSLPYLLKADLARLLIVREKGGVYLDSDFSVIRDMVPVISKYDQIFTLEEPW